MSGPRERHRLEARMLDAQRRSEELEELHLRLHDRLLETAASVLQAHEQTAETMERLAETGSAEHAPRRHRAAEWSRRLAEEEARHIAVLGGRDSRGAD